MSPFSFFSAVALAFSTLAPGGDEEDRTPDPLRARQVLSQLSYTPISLRRVVESQDFQSQRPSKSNNTIQFLNSFLRKEVIQPHLPIRLPCYDFTPITNPTLGSVLLAVRLLTLGVIGSHGVTGGVYKARERIHRGMLIRDY